MSESRTADAWNWGGTDLTPRRTATDLSPAEAAKVAEFDAAPEPPEIVVERVAVAMWLSHRAPDEPVIPWSAAAGWQKRHYLRMAAAAIAVLDPS